ncbi:Protein phosphatase Slingshot 2 [Cichlidogyrus casuarinus]|uniref:Protein phosphatase Slingshot 2 n=1 Tax=Cichlidogyrus casuarinus TaxID=1844966 RepID=A0ABD2QB06_9PLAT
MRILRPQDALNLIVGLQSTGRIKYLCIISTLSENDLEEAIILGIDIDPLNQISVGLVIPIYQSINLVPDGDGGFKLTDKEIERLFMPTSVQALWKLFQELQRCIAVARTHSYHPNGINHTWTSYYESLPRSNPSLLQDWLKMDDIENFGRVTLQKKYISNFFVVYVIIKF